jgi:hypothetical protein
MDARDCRRSHHPRGFIGVFATSEPEPEGYRDAAENLAKTSLEIA